MFLLGFRRKLTALALCKSIESVIQWFQIHHRITFATIQNPAVYLSSARVSVFSTLVPRLCHMYPQCSNQVGQYVIYMQPIDALVFGLRYNTSKCWVQIYTRRGAKSSILNCNPV